MTLLSFFSTIFLILGVPGAVRFDPSSLIFLAIGALFLGLIVLCLRTLLRRFEFYNNGAVIRLLGCTREFPYEGAVSLTHRLTARSVQGIQSGTTVFIRFTTADGHVFRFTGIRAGSTGLSRSQGRPEDGLDFVRDTIAFKVAQHMIGRLSRGEHVLWCNRVGIRANGVVVPGPAEQGILPWQQIELIRTSKGKIELRCRTEDIAIAKLDANARDFYSCMELTLALSEGQFVVRDELGRE